MTYKFINPYNFISLNKECRRISVDENEKEKLSGYINCELETLTPLIMIDSMSKETNNDHVTYSKTFTINGVPSIPASELRGCVRSKFEILTNSCFSNYEGDDIFYGRFKDGALRKPGLLVFSKSNNPNEKTNEVRLIKAKKYEVSKNTYKSILEVLKTGCTVRFNKISKNVYDPLTKKTKLKTFAQLNDKGEFEGIYKEGELFAGKTSKHIFVPDTDVLEPINNRDKLEKLYEKCCELSEINLGRKHNSYTEENLIYTGKNKDFKEKILKPVWYQIIGGYVYISLGQNGQVQYEKSMNDVLPQSYHQCTEEDKLCEACYVFGTINQNRGSNLKVSSKVRFSDARAINATENDCYWKKGLVVLPELASPKFTNAYFYLQAFNKDDMELPFKEKWNVDTLISRKEEFKFFEENRIRIRGHKEYWHHFPKFQEQDPGNMNVTVNPVKEGVKYQFKVYFNDITQEQLEHLWLALSLGKSEDFAHKLGMGKPLGFGSVKIRVQKIMLRNLTVLKDEQEVLRTIDEYVPEYSSIRDAFSGILSEQQLDEIECMYSLSYLHKRYKGVENVDYPRNTGVPPKGKEYDQLKEESKIFHWFASNKKIKLPKANKNVLQTGEVKKSEKNIKK